MDATPFDSRRRRCARWNEAPKTSNWTENHSEAPSFVIFFFFYVHLLATKCYHDRKVSDNKAKLKIPHK